MKKVLFINFPVNGHVNPQINFCRELAEKEVKLIYYTFDDFFPKFKGIENIELRKYPDDFKNFMYKLADNKDLHEQISSLLYVFYILTEKILPFIMEEVDREKPDLILCDTLAVWSKIAARYYNIPHAFFFSSLMGDSLVMKRFPSFKSSLIKSFIVGFPYLVKINGVQKGIERKYGKVSEKMQNIMSHQGKFSLVVTSKEFHPSGDEYPDNVKFIGPAHIDDSELPDNKDTIFISMGTIAFSDTFWDICIEAAKDLGYNVAVSFGGNKNHRVNTEHLPDNVKIYDNLSLQEYKNMLKRSALFISHGGFNSVSDSVLYKTPLIVCPDQAEQVSNGILVQEYGCGILYNPKQIKVEELRSKITQVINNEDIKVNLEKYRQSFINSMGCKKAVEELNKAFSLF